MPEARSIVVRVISALNLVVGALIIWGGGQEALFYWRDAPLNVAVGSTGVLVGALLVLSGFGLWQRRLGARALAFAASGGTILVHGIGMLLGFIGVPGLFIGVAYPAFVMAWLARTRPGLGGTSPTEARRPESKTSRRNHLRVESAVA